MLTIHFLCDTIIVYAYVYTYANVLEILNYIRLFEKFGLAYIITRIAENCNRFSETKVKIFYEVMLYYGTSCAAGEKYPDELR